jgi:N-acyl-D-aspartate/D-glutamate deacylase
MPDWVQEGGTQALLDRLTDPRTRRQVLAEAGVTWAGGIPLRWANVVVAASGPFGDAAWCGKTVQQLATEAGVSPEEMMLDIVVRSRDIGLMIVFNRLESDVQAFLAHPLGMIGSDGLAISADGPWGRSPVHPRFYGAFPRVLAHFVRTRHALPLEEAIRKMTSLPADRLGLKGRGRLVEGAAADLVIFDPLAIQDQATFEEPHRYPTGISHVMVNGQWAVYEGAQTAARSGQVLRRV